MQKVSVSELNPQNYVGVDNLLKDRGGKKQAAYLPDNGNVTQYFKQDVLIGNIRPYLRKIWYSNQSGGASGDVLIVQNKTRNAIRSRYLYQVLSDDSFFHYNMQNAKGSKMPRGNKEAIMKYQFILPPLSQQAHIVSILDKFDELTASMSQGLPREIEQRQKQYEYFRDKLLKF
ncbi:restriction endonuclease subunit S [Streptococcus suis]